jgi:hypothetical protein
LNQSNAAAKQNGRCVFIDEEYMAKVKTTRYGLRPGHQNDFRRTVTVGKGAKESRVQLLFRPGTWLELTEQEVVGIKDLIDGGLIIEWGTDPKGRDRPVRHERPAGPTPEQAADLKALQAENDSLKGQVEELTAQVAELTTPLDDESETGRSGGADE